MHGTAAADEQRKPESSLVPRRRPWLCRARGRSMGRDLGAPTAPSAAACPHARTLPKDKGIYLSISYHQFTTSSTRLGSASIFLAAHSVSNYNSFNFFVSSLTTHRIKKFVRNIIYFVVACFIIDKSSSKNNLNVTIFAQFFK
jgi:hypothetical protein